MTTQQLTGRELDAASITADDLLAEGFREFQIPIGSQHHKLADRFFQLCIRGPQGQKLYYINAYLYDWSAFHRHGPKTSLLFEIHAYANVDRTDHFTFSYSPEGKPLPAVMAFMAVAWGRLSSVPYEREAEAP